MDISIILNDVDIIQCTKKIFKEKVVNFILSFIH